MEKEIEKKEIECEKCGGEVGVRIIGDEGFDYCKDCNWITY